MIIFEGGLPITLFHVNGLLHARKIILGNNILK